VVEQGVLNMGLGLALGDVSVLVSTGASVLTGLAYSRSHEREADCYAMALMRHASLPTAPMGQLLLAIAHDEEDDAKNREKTPEQSPESRTDNASAPQSPPRDSAAKGSGRGDAKVHPVWSLLSSHPGTVQRATELVQGHTPHCDKG
jgi:Zn-dependent protease with chaperone function